MLLQETSLDSLVPPGSSLGSRRMPLPPSSFSSSSSSPAPPAMKNRRLRWWGDWKAWVRRCGQSWRTRLCDYYCYYSDMHRDHENPDTFRNLPWWSRTPTTRQYLVKQFKVRSLLTTALVLCCLIWVLLIWDPHSHDAVFRASEPVPTLVARQARLQQLSQRLHTYLHEHPTVCGVAAPVVHVYEQYAVVRLQAKGDLFLDLFNPQITWATGGTFQVYEEQCLLCPVTAAKHRAMRSTAIQVSYDTATTETRLLNQTFTDTTAICIQHYVDMFAGTWMCGNTVDVRIPRYHEDL